MLSTVVHARAGSPPRGVEDLSGDGEDDLDRESLILAGQALTWQSAFSSGTLTAIPLSRTSALLVRHDGDTGPEQWHDRFVLGLVHRMKGELSIATVTARLLAQAAGGDSGDDAELLASAIDGFAGLLGDLDETRTSEGLAEQMVRDVLDTHSALLNGLVHQQLSVRQHEEFTIHTIRSASSHLTRSELERLGRQVGLPWPALPRNGVGRDLGMARWRSLMQSQRHQMWCRVEKNVLVTELWLRAPEDRSG
ncbi:hypothetical protein NE236_29835 [Actinoallomurus purpureus]|uniref:hypothetical protein n=1 Tax=Actinoallomurus purpureus TaxID=478114 RepID=UPI002093F9B9|nr:hypothetical protein [Actinoallomurus purpureus]MCO6009178.1 hypothetical protein [Actinoallomurus purpureus]